MSFPKGPENECTLGLNTICAEKIFPPAHCSHILVGPHFMIGRRRKTFEMRDVIVRVSGRQPDWNATGRLALQRQGAAAPRFAITP
mmetsp:Transcript_24936/g.52941  ORF Transcript_24936/g.52941 Transcript_24936/m.52941 type:complete len:86 (-) Transcript_24936:1379-1636(-)